MDNEREWQRQATPQNIKVQWLPADSIYGPNYKVLEDPQAQDVRQGHLANCWLIASLAALAHSQPKVLQSLIGRESSFFRVQLFQDGGRTSVRVTDVFPIIQSGSNLQPVFAHSPKKKVGFPLIEKAIARLYDSYAALHRGTAVEALMMLTGGPCHVIDLMAVRGSPERRKSFWRRFRTLLQDRYAIVGSTAKFSREEGERVGLSPQHAFAVLDAVEFNGVRFVKLYNPWGKSEWKGDFGPDSFNQNMSGTFFMSLENFLFYFSRLEMAYHLPGYYSKSFYLQRAWPGEECVRVRIYSTTDMFLILYQENARNKDASFKYLDLWIMVFEVDPTNDEVPGRMVKKSEYGYHHFVQTQVVLEPGEYFIYVFSIAITNPQSYLHMCTSAPVETSTFPTGLNTIRSTFLKYPFDTCGDFFDDQRKDSCFFVHNGFCVLTQTRVNRQAVGEEQLFVMDITEDVSQQRRHRHNDFAIDFARSAPHRRVSGFIAILDTWQGYVQKCLQPDRTYTVERNTIVIYCIDEATGVPIPGRR